MTALLHRRSTANPTPPDTGGGSSLPSMSASWSDLVADSYGVNIHPAYANDHRGLQAYQNNGPNYPALPGETNGQRAIREAMVELGVRHYRDRVVLSSTPQANVLNDLRDAGIGGLTVVGRPDAGSGTLAQRSAQHLNKIKSYPAGTFHTITGANEWNLQGGADWLSVVRAWQQFIWADPGTFDVAGPSMGARKSYSTLGRMETLADFGDGHHYPGGRVPEWQLDALIDDVRRYNHPGQIVDVTETGYHNGLRSTSGHFPTPESVAGVYGPRMILEHYRNPLVRRMYSYELVDQHRNGALDYHEDHFGLCAYDDVVLPTWRRKPIFHAIRRLLALTSDTTKEERAANVTYSPAALPLTITFAEAGLRSVLLGKRDGSYLLCLWRNQSIWTPGQAGGTARTVTPLTATVTIDGGTVNRYRPSVSSTSTGQTTGTTHAVSLDANVNVLRIQPD